MLTEQEQQEIAQTIRQYGTLSAVTPEALMIVQQHRGWVSDEHVRDIADLLSMTPAEVDAVATFYSRIYRRPVGRHIILLCDSVSCWVMGFNRLHEHLAFRLGITFGETTPDGRFTLLPTVCLGACDRAPAMMIDDELFGNLTPAQVDDILSRYA